MTATIADLWVTLGLKPGGFEAGLRQAQSNLDAFTYKVSATGAKMAEGGVVAMDKPIPFTRAVARDLFDRGRKLGTPPDGDEADWRLPASNLPPCILSDGRVYPVDIEATVCTGWVTYEVPGFRYNTDTYEYEPAQEDPSADAR